MSVKITDGLTERQDAALRFLAIIEDKRFAEVRRDALRAYADQALADPNIAEAVPRWRASCHKPEQDGAGCTCGFCVWSVEHVVVMSIREAWGLKV